MINRLIYARRNLIDKIEHFIRYFYTIKHLKPSQLFFFLLRRGLPPKGVSISGEVALNSSFRLHPPLNITVAQPSLPFRFSFLNLEKQFSEKQVDWCPEDVPRLWRYNLHYFDFLREADRKHDEKCFLMRDWVAQNPQGREPGWEPFTVSLRIVNWIFFLTQYPQRQCKDLLHSLFLQTLWLEKNDERHILANHYFENLKALTFAGAFFKGKDAGRWLHKGCNGIIEQIEEQTLDDGGHYERSPQYHGLMLKNYLDLYNLAINNGDLFDTAFTERLQQHCVAGIIFYQTILFPDQTVPLFNDSTFGTAPSLSFLDAYYQRISGIQRREVKSNESLIELSVSGFYGYRSGRDMVIINAGDISPGYQPGHTHCDMLSYELMLAGQRVVVDSGVCGYDPGPMRKYVRSTRAHNTVSVDGKEQSEVWSEFRVARRAKMMHASIKSKTIAVGDSINGPDNSHKDSTIVCFEGKYCGFHILKGTILHHRAVVIEVDKRAEIKAIHITDTINGSGPHKVESYIHLHPDIKLIETDVGLLKLIGVGGLHLQLSIPKEVNCFFEKSYYCPEFGKRIRNRCVVLHIEQCLPCQLTYSLKRM